jgi:hypothetical protein
MGGEIFCFQVSVVTVLYLLPEIAPESDVRMAQIVWTIVY